MPATTSAATRPRSRGRRRASRGSGHENRDARLAPGGAPGGDAVRALGQQCVAVVAGLLGRSPIGGRAATARVAPWVRSGQRGRCRPRTAHNWAVCVRLVALSSLATRDRTVDAWIVSRLGSDPGRPPKCRYCSIRACRSSLLSSRSGSGFPSMNAPSSVSSSTGSRGSSGSLHRNPGATVPSLRSTR